MPADPPIHSGVRIGHVHMNVADFKRTIAFYRDVLGFEIKKRYESHAAFLSRAVITTTSD